MINSVAASSHSNRTFRRGRVALLVLLAATITAASAGCALVQPVQPWEKGVLAKPEMGFENDRLDASFAEHTYASKEAASGGSGVGGGGCGCN